jgi:hypothetical protein
MGRMFSERLAVSLTLLLIGSGLMLSTFGLSFAELGGAFSPTFFPQIVLIGWIALAALAVIADAASGGSAHGGGAPRARWAAAGAVALALLAAALLMSALGFFLCAAGLSALILAVTGQRSPWLIAAYSIAVPAALSLLFSHALKMPLPASPVFWWI